MSALEASLLIHLRGTGEEGFSMPPRTARATPLGLQLPAERLLEETRFQKRRGAVVVGPAGCGKSHWLHSFAQDLAEQRPVRHLRATEAAPRAAPTNAALLVDGWDAASPHQRAALRAWLDAQLQARPDLDAVLLTRADALAMEFNPATWLEFQWAPPGRDQLEAALDDWTPRRRQALLACLNDPCLSIFARRPGLWSLWPQTPPADHRAVRDWAQCLDADSPALSEYRRLCEHWQEPIRELRWIALPAGECLVGSPDDEAGRWSDEGPQQTISLQAFDMTDTAVTNAHFHAAMEQATEAPPWWGDARFARPNQPLTGLAQPVAAAWAARQGCALPSETQWEYACRAGTTAARYAESAPAIAWYAGNSGFALQDVARLAANPFGLYDMLGNTWEWAADQCHESPADAPRDGTPWRGGDMPCHMLRGGTWADRERVIRAATRLKGHPGPRIANIGLRLVRH